MNLTNRTNSGRWRADSQGALHLRQLQAQEQLLPLGLMTPVTAGSAVARTTGDWARVWMRPLPRDAAVTIAERSY